MLRKYKLGYEKFRIRLQVILCVGLFTSIDCISYENETSTSLIAEFVQNFMKPYLEAHFGEVESLYQETTFPTEFSNFEATQPSGSQSTFSSIVEAINYVITKLQPFLQDDEHDYDKYFENDETTIIEILPKSEVQANVPNISKYEKMKSDIKLALEKENVSDKTTRMVTKTLDELIGQVLSNKCSWRSANISSTLRSGKESITPQEWDDLKTQYLEFLNKKHANLSRALEMFNNFHRFFSKVLNETQSMSGRLRFKCQVLEDDPKVVQRSAAACKDFKVCSSELRDFLQNVYNIVNETTVSVFTNYAAMYVRDVSDGEHGRSLSVPKVVERAAKTIEQRVAKVYVQELLALKLDQNRNPEVNIRTLRNHVKFTVKHVVRHVMKNIYTDLKPLKSKLFQTIQKDLNINLDVELGNQESDLKQRICTVFMTCNGRVSENRRSFSSYKGVSTINPNSIYVKLQLSVDDKIKNDVSQLFRGTKSTTKNYNKHKYYVTRTTVPKLFANYSANLYLR